LCALSPVALDDWRRPLALAGTALRWARGLKVANDGQKEQVSRIQRLCLRTWGAVLHRAGRHVEAIAALTEAMKLAPDGKGEAVEWAWLALAHAARGEKGGKEALLWLKRASQVAPKRDGDGLWEAVLLEVLLSEGQRVTRAVKVPDTP
jgi:hypothetical protein